MMTNEDALQIARIEAALSRIERGLAARQPGRSESDYAHLAARHDALRSEVMLAIAELSASDPAQRADR